MLQQPQGSDWEYWLLCWLWLVSYSRSRFCLICRKQKTIGKQSISQMYWQMHFKKSSYHGCCRPLISQWKHWTGFLSVYLPAHTDRAGPAVHKAGGNVLLKPVWLLVSPMVEKVQPNFPNAIIHVKFMVVRLLLVAAKLTQLAQSTHLLQQRVFVITGNLFRHRLFCLCLYDCGILAFNIVV